MPMADGSTHGTCVCVQRFGETERVAKDGLSKTAGRRRVCGYTHGRRLAVLSLTYLLYYTIIYHFNRLHGQQPRINTVLLPRGGGCGA